CSMPCSANAARRATSRCRLSRLTRLSTSIGATSRSGRSRRHASTSRSTSSRTRRTLAVENLDIERTTPDDRRVEHRWDPDRYLQYADERSRPFLDLLARVRASSPRRVVDLGCGPATLTALLARRWPEADVVGIDSSPEM